MSETKRRPFSTAVLWRKLIENYKPHAGRLILYLLLSIFSAATVILSAQFRTDFIDAVLDNGNTKEAVLTLLLQNLIVIFGIRFLFPALQNHLEKSILPCIFLRMEMKVGKKKCTIPWPCHEDTETNDKMELLQDISDQVWLYFKGIANIMSIMVSTVGMFFLMMKLGIIFVVLLFLLFIPVAYFSVRAASTYYDTWQRTAKLRRYCDYQRNIMMDKEYATERILFEYAPFFLTRWKKDYQEVRSLSIREELKGSKKMQAGGMLYCLYIAVLVAVMVYGLGKGRVTVGYAVSLISIFPSLMDQMIITLSNEMNRTVRAGYAVKALAEFEALEDEEGAFDLPKPDMDFSEIVFKQVSFQYPKTSKWVLKNVDMRFEKGKHYAIVGENGAGKSTVIKLLLRLYRVTEGEILIDGKNINQIPHEELLGLITALFQDHQHYYTNISENIGIGDINHIHDTRRIVDSAKKANFHERIGRMPDGYGTVLGTMHNGGIDLSGGEWQKLAIARLTMSPCPVKILDEPTAAMDPMFEYALYQDFNRIMEGRTTISISHRLASCRNADHVYVLDHGGVLEQGKHDELMEDGKLYYKMYTTQKEMYQ